MLSSLFRRVAMTPRTSLSTLRPSSTLTPSAFFSSSSTTPSSTLLFSPLAWPRLSRPLLAEATAPSFPATSSPPSEPAATPSRKQSRGRPPIADTTEMLTKRQLRAEEKRLMQEKIADRKDAKIKKDEAEAAAKAERLQLRQKLAARKAAERNKRLEKRQALRDIIRERRAKAKAKADAKRAVLRQAKERLKENAPRRPATAFLLWNNERTRGMTSEQHGKAKERAKAGGAMWQAMSDEEKAPWRARSVQVREEYQEALRRFRAEHVTPNTLPRPPLNGYVRYTTQRIPQLRAQRPGLHVSAYLTQAAADWREMGGEEKAEWNRVDEGEKAVFDRAKAEFLQKPKEDRMFGKMAKRVGRVVAKQTKGRGQLSEEKVGAGGGGVGV